MKGSPGRPEQQNAAPALRIAGIYAVVAGVWIFASDRLLGLLVPDPNLLTQFAIYKGLGFVAITALMLYGLVRQALLNREAEPSLHPSTDTQDILGPRMTWPLLAFGIITAIIVAIGTLVVRYQKQTFRLGEQAKLSTVAQFKTQQLDAWVETGVHQIQYAANRSIMAHTAHHWFLEGCPEGEVRDQLQERLKNLLQAGDHSCVTMRDRQGALRLMAGTPCEELPLLDFAKKAMELGQVQVVADTPPEHPPLVHIFTPIATSLEGATQVVGCLQLTLDANLKLIPDLEAALRETTSADILVVGFRKGQASFLNANLRGNQARLPQRELLSALNQGAHATALGSGRFLGGVSWSRQLPWAILATEDSEIVFKATQRLVGYVILLGAVFVATGAGLISFWMKLQHKLYAQRQKRQALETQILEERLDYLSKFANDIVLLIDGEGQILDANDRACSAYDYTREELLALKIKDIRAPEEMPTFGNQWKLANESGACFFETLHRRRDGTTFPVEVSSRRVEFKSHPLVQSIIRDISERKEAENELRRVNRLQALILENSAVGIALVQNEVFQWVNPKLAEMLGGKTSDIQNTPVQAYLDEATGRAVRSKASRGLLGEGWVDIECKTLRLDGQPFWGRMLLKALDPQRPEEGVIIIFEDISARKESEEAIRQAQKLESLGVLAGGIAHDFNNLLTAILGNLNLAQAKMDEEHPSYGYLGNVEKTIQKAADLTRQMLAYSGKGRFIVKPNDINGIINEMAKLLRVSIPKKIELNLELTQGLPPVISDAAQIQQVVMNLVTNAADAIGNAVGNISIRSSQATLDPQQVPSAYPGKFLAPGPYLRLEVEDSGCGMAPEVVARIFDPFFSTKNAGRGLGLSAMLGILRGHQAGIRIDSRPGEGSRFEIFFPLAELPLESHPAEAPATAAPPKGIRVLLVDDEPMIRETATLVLEALGMAVTEAADGEEALECFKATPQDLVILDLTMPRMDGREAFRLIRDLSPGTPIIVCSGYSEQESILDAQGNPPTAFLAKPYSLTTLENLLQEVLASRA